MGIFTADDTLKVVVLGNDGIMRGMLIPRNSKLALNKYIITQKDVFLQRSKKHSLFEYDQPTIMFRENSAHAIPKDGQESFPTPIEMADTIENAAMHLFTLFGVVKPNIWLIAILIAACVAAGAACGGVYFGYENNKILTDISNNGLIPTDDGGAGSVDVIPQNTVVPTTVITAVPTALPTATPVVIRTRATL
jgi:hypothetical protein